MGIKGDDVFELFVTLTGMSRDCVTKELGKYLDVLNLDLETITENDLRQVMSLYLEDLNCSISQQEYDSKYSEKANA